MTRRWGFWVQGWALWGLALAAVFALPGLPWHAAQPPDFPWENIPASVLVLAALVGCSLGLAWMLGPRAARSRGLALWEAPPELLWGGLTLALWPAAWGPPGRWAWATAFLLAALPMEVRWLAQALPREHPFPAAWGRRVQLRARGRSLWALAPGWVAVRVPLWLTGTLVLERILAVRGLGSDWMARVAAQDHRGLAIWILVYALLWSLAQGRKELS